MRNASKKPKKRKKSALFGQETLPESEPVVDAIDLKKHLDSSQVSVSLRYYLQSCECFSDWQKIELKKFSSTLLKLRSMNSDKLKRYKPLCDLHKGSPNEGRFSIPDEISPDISIYEIKIDPSNKLRMHGFFVGQVFFLLWLDRNHACFKV